jgi:hypothetical protein
VCAGQLLFGGGCKHFSEYRRRRESTEVSFSAARFGAIKFFNRRRRRISAQKSALYGKLLLFGKVFSLHSRFIM